jgi:hypothetical protein
MGWLELRAEIAKCFHGVSIEKPAKQIVKVYETPPAKIGDTPCVVIYPPKREVVARSYGARTMRYTVSCLALLRDADASTAAEMIDAFAEAVLDPFDEATALHGVDNAALISQTVDAPRGNLLYAGVAFVGFDCVLVIGTVESKELKP